jgi:hypothetical protein
MMDAADHALAELRIGDCITFQNASANESFYLEGDGTLDNRLTVSNPPTSMHECVFEICARTRVAAAEEVERFLGKLVDKPLSSMDQIEREMKKAYLATLIRVRDKEDEMNKRFMSECVGTPVVYGDVVQLKHVRSGKFLTASDSSVSISEPENFVIYLADSASTLSWFSLNPAKAYNTMAEPVINTGEVVISIASAEQEGECVHISRFNFVDPNILKMEAAKALNASQETYEVNVSLTKQAWRCTLYCKGSEASSPNVQAGDILYFNDPQAKAYLQIAADETDASGARVNTNMVPFAKALEGAAFTSYSSDAYFIVEKADHDAVMGAAGAEIGGTIQFGEELVLRHLNTNLRLTCDGNQLTGKPSDGFFNNEYVHLESTKSHEPRGVVEGEAMRIFAQTHYLRSGGSVEDAEKTGVLMMDNGKPKTDGKDGKDGKTGQRQNLGRERRLSIMRRTTRSVDVVISAEESTPMLTHRGELLLIDHC